MEIRCIDCDSVFETYEYNSEENFFVIKDSVGDNELIYYPVLDIVECYNPQNFEMHFLINEKCFENSIYRVKFDGVRVGWMFPIQALVSQEHDYAKDDHFLKYAYVAIHKLLEYIKQDDYCFNESQFDMVSYFKKDCQILLVDKSNTEVFDDYSINNYVVSLFKKGYFFSGEGNAYTSSDVVERNINLTKLPDDIKNTAYINALFKSLIPIQMENFAKFHTLYQIIEILITVIFDVEFKKFVLELGENTDRLFNKKEKLDSLAVEKYRIKQLFSSYTGIIKPKIDILNTECLKLLEKYSIKQYKTVAENIYAVRCLIVHSLYILDNESKEIIAGINSVFLDVIIDMLFTFKIPE